LVLTPLEEAGSVGGATLALISGSAVNAGLLSFSDSSRRLTEEGPTSSQKQIKGTPKKKLHTNEIRVGIRKFEMIPKKTTLFSFGRKVEESRMRAWLRKKSSIERSTRCSN